MTLVVTLHVIQTFSPQKNFKIMFIKQAKKGLVNGAAGLLAEYILNEFEN